MAPTRTRIAPDAHPSDSTLSIRRRLPVPRDEVFRAWTTQEHVQRWFCPVGFQVVESQLDLRIGGRYRIGMRAPTGDVHTATGIYRDVQVPERLVYTWRWEEPEALETLVTVEFHDLGQETELVLRHERFADRERRDRHMEGWLGCLQNLEAYFASGAGGR